MPLSANLLLAVTALCWFATVFAFPMEGFTMDHQCRCLSATNNYINPRWFQKIEILPPGPHCRNIEILLTLKDKRTVCVDPEADWVQKLINKIIKRRVKK